MSVNKLIFWLFPFLLFASPFQTATQEKFDTLKTLMLEKAKLPLDPYTEMHNFCVHNKDFVLIFDQNTTPCVFIKQHGTTLLLEEKMDDVCVQNRQFVFLKGTKVYVVLEDSFKEIPFDVGIKKAFLEKYFPQFSIEPKDQALWIYKNAEFTQAFVLDFFHANFPKHRLLGSIDELQYFLEDSALVVPINSMPYLKSETFEIPFELFQKQGALKKVHMHLDPLLDAFYAFFPELSFSLQKYHVKTRECALKTFIDTHTISFIAPQTKPKSTYNFLEKTYLEDQNVDAFLSYEIMEGVLKLTNAQEFLIAKTPTLFIKVLGFKQDAIKSLNKPPFSKVDVLNFWKSACLILMLGIEESFEDIAVFKAVEKSVVCQFDICLPLKFDWEKKGFFQKTRFFSKARFLQKSPFFYKLGTRKMPPLILEELNRWIISIDVDALVKWLQSFKSRNVKEDRLEPYFSKRNIEQFKLVFFKLKSTLFEAKINKKRLNLLEFAKNVRPDLYQ